MITQMKYNCLNGARTSKIHQDGAAPGLNRLTSATGGQPFMSRGTRGHKEYYYCVQLPEDNALECRRACQKED